MDIGEPIAQFARDGRARRAPCCRAWGRDGEEEWHGERVDEGEGDNGRVGTDDHEQRCGPSRPDRRADARDERE